MHVSSRSRPPLLHPFLPVLLSLLQPNPTQSLTLSALTSKVKFPEPWE